jgi:hypothetical protein
MVGSEVELYTFPIKFDLSNNVETYIEKGKSVITENSEFVTEPYLVLKEKHRKGDYTHNSAEAKIANDILYLSNGKTDTIHLRRIEKGNWVGFVSIVSEDFEKTLLTTANSHLDCYVDTNNGYFEDWDTFFDEIILAVKE